MRMCAYWHEERTMSLNSLSHSYEPSGNQHNIMQSNFSLLRPENVSSIIHISIHTMHIMQMHLQHTTYKFYD